MGPQLYLILVLAAATPITYGYMWVKQQVVVKRAYDDGKTVGREEVAAATAATSRERVASVEEGIAEPVVIPAERQKLIELCNRSASCRSRTK